MNERNEFEYMEINVMLSRKNKLRQGLGMVLAFGVTGWVLGDGPNYTVTDLGVLDGGTKSWAYDINETGLVTGCSEVDFARGEKFGFLWRDGVRSELQPLDGQSHSWGLGLNDADQWVVGQTILNGNIGITTSVFVSTEDFAPEIFDFLAVPKALSSDLNDNTDPQAVGWFHTGDLVASHAVLHAFQVKIDGLLNDPVDLGTLGGISSWAYANNDRNEVVGGSNVEAGPMHAFLWDGSAMQNLGTLGGSLSEATDINEEGLIVGWSRTKTGATHAFISNGAQMYDIGTLGSDYSMAYGINDAGQVVGVSKTAEGVLHAFLYEIATQTMYDLNDLVGAADWNLQNAQAINERGQIVGWGVNGDGDTRGFVLNAKGVGLALTEPTPGIAGASNRFEIRGAEAGTSVILAYGLRQGQTAVPGCGGLEVRIRNPKIVGQVKADGAGLAVINRVVQSGAEGVSVLFQAVSLASCDVSNLVNFTFK